MPKGKVLVKDKLGNTFMVDKTDERYLSGELVFFWKGRNHTEETKKIKRELYQENRYQDGKKNSQYGTCWITNDKGVNKKIKEKDILSHSGFVKGRTIKVPV